MALKLLLTALVLALVAATLSFDPALLDEERWPTNVCTNPGVPTFDRVANSWRECWVLPDGSVVSSRAY